MTAVDRAAEIICVHACELDGGCDNAAQALADAGLLAGGSLDYMTESETPDEWGRGFKDGWNACLAIVKGET